ncbi:peptidoglycan D,D-transpeptidase FtsI family protein [Luteipulveratus mongoliensis]|uniref:Cell division protein FtsI n=1 Tax=Luteipulveratus mongoliensis TaxID=571913 RepID=A0A0K1JDY3_9MICO|nr:penicillin-binding transpeptidase domain-containing protein [Luteipulveratus mongoliensis]AKU14927.1 cell division protein FtsI [Luteipulveratus mongoliensis]
MNSPIRRIGIVAAAMFCALLMSSTLIQFVQAKELQDRPGNRRTLLASYSKERGSILVGGTAVARSDEVDDNFKWQRKYPQPQLYAPVTGYYSFTYGAGRGVEGSYDDLLSGSSDRLFYRRMVDVITGKPPQGATLELTIDPKVQKAAWDALGNQRGAIVALDPKTGAILAMVSKPTYDPNVLAGHDLPGVSKAWTKLSTDKSRPLTNRAIGGDLYPPGSTFKLITTAAALESGQYTPESVLPGPAALDLPQTTVDLPNVDGRPCGPNDKTTMAHALQISCNSAYGSLGMSLGQTKIRDQAHKFGYGQAVTVPMRVTPSIFPTNLNQPQLAQSAIGQFDVRATPMQVAMVSASIANGGREMTPYLVKNVRDKDLDVIDSTDPEEFAKPISKDTAGQINTMMQAVVEAGSGRKAKIPGMKVAGKTGTAQSAKGALSDVWFTGFAPADNPRVAVAVVVEDGGTMADEASGGVVAAPIARKVMEAVVSQ